MTSFHEVRFPTDISRRASGGPERRTHVVTLGSGFEQRNQQWADSRRRYQAGYGVKSIDDIHTALAFFEERRGRLHGFRWKDWADYKSCAPRQPPAANDQTLGTGDGTRTEFQLIKVYGSAYAPWTRDIAKPVSGTVLVAVDGITQTAGSDFTVDETTGLITFTTAPESGLSVTAGYEFDVPVRFDTDRIDVDLSHFEAGAMPDIPIVEIRL
jgi:uncharacterized protein (TIGR02217 family)